MDYKSVDCFAQEQELACAKWTILLMNWGWRRKWQSFSSKLHCALADRWGSSDSSIHAHTEFFETIYRNTKFSLTSSSHVQFDTAPFKAIQTTSNKKSSIKSFCRFVSCSIQLAESLSEDGPVNSHLVYDLDESFCILPNNNLNRHQIFSFSIHISSFIKSRGESCLKFRLHFLLRIRL